MSRLLAALVLLGGCHNACQDVCTNMADYAEHTCGLVVPDGQLDACYQAQAGSASRDVRGVCRQFNGPNAIADEWDCSELEDYFDAAP